MCHLIIRKLTSSNKQKDLDIVNDIKRTLVNDHLLSTDTKQAMMLPLLKAYAEHDIDVGYCQGINFIVGLLVRQFEQSEKSFFGFQNVMKGISNLRSFYSSKFPGVLKLNKRFDQLMSHYVPAVYVHIKKQQLIVDMLSTGWFISLLIPNVCLSLAEWILIYFVRSGYLLELALR
eukprot:TRINITY_DN6483_c1_g1_i1.p1 TRINITY_DN6483_c1_g1~~TRINITY_DN6483_c1_g1_i1.p1  ORF type:complete len:175 (-),score=11.43 TRINITY_DN6483_c1_g1_i1:25-549(-)